MFTTRRWGLAVFVLLMPLEVHVAPDSTEAIDPGARINVDLVGGGGAYSIVPRNCEGRQTAPAVRVPYRDAAAAVEISNHWWKVGVRGGWLRTERDVQVFTGQYTPVGPTFVKRRLREEVSYVNPHASFHWKFIGLGAGGVLASNEFPEENINGSGHLRLGSPRGSFEISLMEGMPLLSGGGYLRIGGRLHVRDRANLFFGISTDAGPFDKAGPMMNVDVRVTKRYSVLARGRMGSAGGVNENGVAVGLRWWGGL